MSTITQGFLDHKIFSIVSEVAESLGVRAFVIGGYVRDCFLGRPSKDIDIVVEGSGIALAEAVGEKVRSNVSVFKNFGTAMLRFQGIEVEFVGARKESYRRDSRKPIVEDGTLEDDQLRRDFTINAMAFSLQKDDFGALVDPFGGIRDLAAGIIRTPLDPDTTYSDDPLRMVRAIRFATKLSTPEQTFTIVPESLESIARNRQRMEILSKERIVEELNKMLVTPKPSIGFQLLDQTGLLDYILPQLAKLKGVESVDGKGHKENFTHTLEVLDNVAEAEMQAIAEGTLKDYLFEDGVEVEKVRTEPNVWLRWAALLHDIAKNEFEMNCMGYEFPEINADILTEDGTELVLGNTKITVMHTPGHSKGGVCYLFKEDLVMFSGDTLFRLCAGRADLYGGNGRQVLRSLANLGELEGNYKVYPGHEDDTTLDFERENNRYMRTRLRRQK